MLLSKRQELGKSGGSRVVADEIRKLATSSKENVDQINGITKNIQEFLFKSLLSDIHTLTDTVKGDSGILCNDP